MHFLNNCPCFNYSHQLRSFYIASNHNLGLDIVTLGPVRGLLYYISAKAFFSLLRRGLVANRFTRGLTMLQWVGNQAVSCEEHAFIPTFVFSEL